MFGLRIDPGDHEHRVSLTHGMGHHRVIRLQIEDVVLVDEGRHHQQGPSADSRCRGRILDQLDHIIAKHHRALGQPDIHTDLESPLVSDRNMPATDIGHHVLESLAQALALGLDHLLLRVGIGREEIRRRHRINPLLSQEADPIACQRIRIDRIGHMPHKLGIEQIERGVQGKGALLGPRRCSEALVGQGRHSKLRRREISPELLKFGAVIGLQRHQSRGINVPRRHACGDCSSQLLHRAGR